MRGVWSRELGRRDGGFWNVVCRLRIVKQETRKSVVVGGKPLSTEGGCVEAVSVRFEYEPEQCHRRSSAGSCDLAVGMLISIESVKQG